MKLSITSPYEGRNPIVVRAVKVGKQLAVHEQIDNPGVWVVCHIETTTALARYDSREHAIAAALALRHVNLDGIKIDLKHRTVSATSGIRKALLDNFPPDGLLWPDLEDDRHVRDRPTSRKDQRASR